MNKKKYLHLSYFLILQCFIFTFLAVSPANASSKENDTAKRLLSIVDYIGGDYNNAISGGKVINELEYNEMLQFSEEANSYSKLLQTEYGDKAGISSKINKLSSLIENKAEPDEVTKLSNTVKKNLIDAYKLETFPPAVPSVKLGKALYASNCSQCHGLMGSGDGQLSAGLDPKPANFQDADFVGNLSPFKIYNTTNFGIKGTAMPAFPQLSEEDKWNIAFYVLTLRHKDDPSQISLLKKNLQNTPDELDDYKLLASSSDNDLRNGLIKLGFTGNDIDKTIKTLRLSSLLSDNQSENKDEHLALAGNLLNESVELYKLGKKDEAYSKAIDAYLDGYENLENKLSVKDRALAINIESKFGNFRNQIKSGSDIVEIEKTYSEINSDLTRASLLLSDSEPIGKLFSFLQSLAIILREGLEAILIVAAIIAYLATTGSKSAIKYVHYGWTSALIAGLITWILAQTVIKISSAQREIIEGVTSLLAAAVLFYVSYWFISKIEVQKWKEFIEGKVKQALSRKNVFTLVGVSFFAVYREAFETVLFYQALWIQTENTKSEVIWGLLAGCVLLIGLFFFIFKLGMRIPLRYFFSVSSTFLYLLSFIFVGNGIYELQSAGIISMTPINFIPKIDILGIYPTLETILPQAFLLVAFLVAFIWIFVIKQERERKEIVISVSKIAEDMKSMHEAFDHIKGHIIEWRRCEDIDLEAEDLDKQIHDVISHVDHLENKLVDFFDVVSKNSDNQPDKLPTSH